MSKFACIACLGWVICLANVCQSSSVQRFVPAAANMPLFGGLKTVEQNNILPSWVPVRPATVSDGSLTGADDSEVWPSLLSNLWQKTEIALFVSPLSPAALATKSLATASLSEKRVQRVSASFSYGSRVSVRRLRAL